MKKILILVSMVIGFSLLSYAENINECKTDIYYVTNSKDVLFLSNGDGTYVETSAPVTNVYSDMDISRIKFGDFNGDGKTDIYYITNNIDSIHLSIGDGNYQTINGPTTIVRSEIDLYRVNFGDFNGDGISDIFFAT